MQKIESDILSELIFENNLFSLLIVDESTGEIIYANTKASACLQYLPGELLNKKIGEVIVNKARNNSTKELLASSGELQRIKTKYNDEYDAEIISEKINYKNRASALLFIKNFPPGALEREMITAGEKNNRELSGEDFIYQLASIVEFSEDAIISKDLNGIVLTWNKAAERLYGYSSEEMIGNSILKIFPDDKTDELAYIFGKIKEGGRIENYETVRIRKDGVKVNVSVTMSPVKDSSGNISGTSAIERDISGKKKIEAENLLREKQLLEAQQIAHLGYWEWDIKSDIIRWSDELYRIFGLDNNTFKITFENFISRFHTEDAESIKNIFEKALHNHRTFESNYKIVLPDGNIKIIYIRGEVLLDDKFNPVVLRGIGQDITNQKRTERRLTAQFEVTKLIAEAGRLLDATPKILQAICAGMDWQIGELWLVDDKSDLLELEGSWSIDTLQADEFIEVSKKCKFGRGVSLQGRVWESGRPVWSSHMVDDQFFPRAAFAAKLNLHTALAFPVLNKEKVSGILAFYKVDVSEPDEGLFKMLESLGRQIGDFIEKKKTEPALQESEGLYQTLVETSPDAITYTDLSGKILFCNQQAAGLFGFRLVEDMLGQNVYAFIAPEDQKHAIENEHNTIISRHTKNVEYMLIKKDGTKFSAEVNTSIVFDAFGKPKAFIEVMRDISRRKRTEDEIKLKIKQQAVVAEVGRQALEIGKIQVLFDEAAKLVVKTLGIEFCDILELQNGNKKLFLKAGCGWNEGVVGNTYLDSGLNSHAGFTLLSKQPVIVENFKREERFYQTELLIDHKIISGLTVVIQGKEEPYGVLGAYTNSRRIFSHDDANFLQAIANTLSSAIENSRLFEESKIINEHLEGKVRERTSELEISNNELEIEIKMRQKYFDELRIRVMQQSAAAELGRKALNSPDLSDLMNETISVISKTLEVQFCGIFEYDSIDTQFILRKGTGWKVDSGFIISTADGDEHLLSYTLMRNDPVIFNNPYSEQRFQIPQIIFEHEIQSGMCIVIKDSGKIFGILGIFSALQTEFTLNDGYFLQSVASVLAAAFERKRSEEMWQGLLESAPDAVVIVNREGTIVLVNNQTERMFGYKREELLGKKIEILVPNRLRKRHLEKRVDYAEEPQARPMNLGKELYALRKNGTEFPAEISLSPFKTDEGILISSSIRDTSERKKIEAATRRQAEIIDQINDVVITANLDGTVTSWNKKAENILGYPSEEIIGKNISSFCEEDSETLQKKIIAPLIVKGSAEIEIGFIKKSGEKSFSLMSLSLLKNDDGETCGIIISSNDYTRLKTSNE